MNKFDKLIAQANGQYHKIPPVIEYILYWKPIDTETSRVVTENGQMYVYTKASPDYVGGPEKEYKKKINPNLLIINYNFYYDDPDETDEERFEKIKKSVFDMPEVKMLQGFITNSMSLGETLTRDYKDIKNQPEFRNTYIKRDEYIYAELKFELTIIRKKPVYEPYFK